MARLARVVVPGIPHHLTQRANRLTQLVDSVSWTITLTYDNLDRLISETTPQGTVSYTYDAAGRRTSMTVTGQPTVNYTYDANRLTQITQGTSTVTFTYDNASRRTSMTLPNGIVTQYSYDAASRITGITYTNGTTTLGNLTYAYDAAGNRTQIVGSWARTNIPQALSSATYNAANQMTAFGSQSLTYDANGNLTADGTNSYICDARNRLASMTSYLYDRGNPVQETSGATVLANILTGLRTDEYFTRADSTGARSFLTDPLGSTLALTDTTGTVQTEYTYEPYGRTTITGSVK
jgi:YD repeat-containing protein